MGKVLRSELSRGVTMPKNDLQGTLDLLVLKTLAQSGSLHGYGIVLHIQKASESLLSVEEGSMYPALHRMEQSQWIASQWSLTETGRKAKYYKLTPTGRKQLIEAEKNFEDLVKGVCSVLRYA
jgi:PadR family transcriptional regulator PadR